MYTIEQVNKDLAALGMAKIPPEEDKFSVFRVLFSETKAAVGPKDNIPFEDIRGQLRKYHTKYALPPTNIDIERMMRAYPDEDVFFYKLKYSDLSYGPNGRHAVFLAAVTEQEAGSEKTIERLRFLLRNREDVLVLFKDPSRSPMNYNVSDLPKHFPVVKPKNDHGPKIVHAASGNGHGLLLRSKEDLESFHRTYPETYQRYIDCHVDETGNIQKPLFVVFTSGVFSVEDLTKV